MALAAGKSVKWVADQLGHSSPMLTLKTYALLRLMTFWSSGVATATPENLSALSR
jgi:integrase